MLPVDQQNDRHRPIPATGSTSDPLRETDFISSPVTSCRDQTAAKSPASYTSTHASLPPTSPCAAAGSPRALVPAPARIALRQRHDRDRPPTMSPRSAMRPRDGRDPCRRDRATLDRADLTIPLIIRRWSEPASASATKRRLTRVPSSARRASPFCRLVAGSRTLAFNGEGVLVVATTAGARCCGAQVLEVQRGAVRLPVG